MLGDEIVISVTAHLQINAGDQRHASVGDDVRGAEVLSPDHDDMFGHPLGRRGYYCDLHTPFLGLLNGFLQGVHQLGEYRGRDNNRSCGGIHDLRDLADYFFFALDRVYQ